MLTNDDATIYLAVITTVIAVGTLISTCEWLWNRAAFADESLLGWSLLQTRRRIWSHDWMVRLATPVLSQQGFLILLITRALACIILATLPTHDVARPAMLTVLLFGSLAMNIRSFPYGLMGPDRMRLVVLGALWLRELAPASTAVNQACLWFIALQCLLSYITPGFTKLFSGYWRSGDALRITFRHRTIGHRAMDAILNQHPKLALMGAWSITLLQLSCPLALLDTRICIAFLSALLMFHIITAVLLGFNHFAWSWASTYPAVLYVTATLH